MTGVITFRAPHTDIYIDSAVSSVSSTANLIDNLSASKVSLKAISKDFKITLPKIDTDKEDYLGVDSNGYQNQGKTYAPASMGECSGTIVLERRDTYGTDPLGTLLSKIYESEDITDAGSDTYKRYLPGKLNSSGAIDDLAIAAVLNYNPTETDKNPKVMFLLNNADMIIEDISFSTDGAVELSISGKCLASDFYGPEVKS